MPASASTGKITFTDDESDPDFVNNAPFTYEKTKGKKRKNVLDNSNGDDSSDEYIDGRKGKRRKEGSVKTRADTLSKTQLRMRARKEASSHNPLLAYFGHDVEFSFSSSEDEDEEDELGNGQRTPVEDEEEEEDEDVESVTGDDLESPKSLRMKSISMSTSQSQSQPQSQSNGVAIKTAGNKVVGDDSVTESETESDEDIPIFPSISKSPLNHLTRQTRRDSNIESDSVTEPESDEDVIVHKDEFGNDDDSIPNIKPAFPLPEGKKPLGPFVLDSGSNIAVPGSINTFLREYQREGVRFFYDRWKDNRGGVLGDDMGLVSKTIQVISFLSAVMRKTGTERDIDRRRNHVSRLQDSFRAREIDWRSNLPKANETWPTCLIVAPSSVVGNWARELEVWGYFEVGVYIGPRDDRAQALKEFKMGRLDILLTSFDTARKDITLLSDLAFSVVFIDEAHKLKNPTSKITLSFSLFSCPIRFGLTGTAIQNSYRELWTLLDWSSPGRLGTEKQWKVCVARPLEVGQSSAAGWEERGKAKLVAKVLVEKILPNFFLRRTKDLIRSQLPQKIDQVVFCPLSRRQIDVYKRILATEDVQDMVRKNEKCECKSGKKRGECHHKIKTGSIFRYLSMLIKVSNHLALILPAPNDNEEQTKRSRVFAEMIFAGEKVPKFTTSMLLPEYCGKWHVLNMLLSDWKKDKTNKVLIFTKSVKLLDMLDHHLNANSFRFCRLDGTTKQADRMPLIDEFNNDPDIFVFLISTLAGGTGLNLTGANKVVIFDPNWNPAHDLQAMDRAYRFGQRRDVFVYRLLGAGSIEELIYARQVYKQQQMRIGYEASNQTRYFQGVQGDTSQQGELFGLRNIFRLHEDTLATKMTIEKAQLAEFDWALAHMGGKRKSAHNSDPGDSTLLDGEAKALKDENELKGLGQLLLDDLIPEADASRDDTTDVLNLAGIQYSHVNDNILRASRVEKEAWKAIAKSSKKRKKAGFAKDGAARSSDEEEPIQWPPRRKHHKAPLSPDSRLRVRQEALIHRKDLGSEADLPGFAAKFASFSHSRQEEFIRELDNYAKQHLQPSM